LKVLFPEDREIRIKIPSHVPTNQHVEVIVLIRNEGTSYQRKITALKGTIDDKLFQEDIRTISNEFQSVDLENWEGKPQNPVQGR